MAAATVLFATTACSEEYEYTPADANLKGAQVYYDESLPKEIKLTSGTESFDIQLSRFNTEGEVTVYLTATQSEEPIYNVPATATFADGNATTTFTVTVNSDDLVFDDMRTISISIDKDNSTPYASGTYTFSVGVPAPWTAWCNNAADFEAEGGMVDWPLGDEGTGDYTFGAMLNGSDTDRKVEFRQNKLTGECQFRILDLATDFYPNFTELVMDAYWMNSKKMYALRIPMVETGYINQGEPIYFSDRLSLAEAFSGENIDWNNADKYKPEMVSTYNPETGLFSFNEVWYLTAAGSGWKGNETLQMHGFYIPDYSVSAVYKGLYTSADGKLAAVGMATLGKDVTDARALVMPQGMEVADIVRDMIAEQPSEELPWVAITESGTFSASFDPQVMETEKLQILIISVVNGEAMAIAKAPFTYYSEANPWVSLGTGLFTDDIMLTSYFNMDAPTYEVEIMEHKDHPGLYRVMNPYTQEVYPLGDALVNEVGAQMAPDGSYLEVNAEDPNAVFIELQSLQCIIDEADGEIGFCTYPVYVINAGQLDFETAKSSGFFGKQVDGVIQFPRFRGPEDKFTFQGLAFGGDNAWYVGTTAGVKIVLPEAVTEEQSRSIAKARQTNRTLRRKNHVPFKANTLRTRPAMTKMAPRFFNK